MIFKSIYFSLDELVCPHVYAKYGETAWSFFDMRLLLTLERLRERLNKPIYINDWQIHGHFDERGFRCIQCEVVKKAITDGTLYVSAHMTGQGVDFDVQGMVAEEVRQYIIANKDIWPYPLRLEAGTSWVHLDTRDAEQGKVVMFNS